MSLYILSEHYLTIGILIILLFGTIYNFSTTLAFPNIQKAILYIITLLLINTIFINQSDLIINTILYNSFFIKMNYNNYILAYTILLSVLIITTTYKYLQNNQLHNFEYYIMMVLIILSTILMTSATEFISFYFCLELQSITVYVLIAYNKFKKSSIEASIKYFIIGSISSVLLLIGFSFFYLQTGITTFEDLYFYTQNIIKTYENNNFLLYGIILISISFFIKTYIVPFHTWVADIYEGTATSSLIIIATIPFFSMFFMLIKFHTTIFQGTFESIKTIIYILSILSIIVGTFGALVEYNLKRILAYSSVTNSGYFLLALLGSDPLTINTAITYIIYYNINTIALMSIIMALHTKQNKIKYEYITDYALLFNKNKIFSILIISILFTVSGLPPFAIFFAKLYLLTNLVGLMYYSLLLIIIVATVLTAIYYINIIKTISYTKENKISEHINLPYENVATLVLIFGINIILLFQPAILDPIITTCVLDLFI